MIDNPRTTARLLEQMQGHLPIPAFPTKEIVRILRRAGVEARVDRALSVKRVFYAGDEGGIVCDVTPTPERQGGIRRLTDPPARRSATPPVRLHSGVPARASPRHGGRGAVAAPSKPGIAAYPLF